MALLHLTTLDASHRGIVHLAGIEYLYNLQTLDLSFNQVTDLAPLAGLPLKYLDLQANRVTDLSPLARLPQLTAVALDGNPVQDLSPLAAAAVLQVVSLRNTSLDSAALAWVHQFRQRGVFIDIDDVAPDSSSEAPSEPPAAVDTTGLPPIVVPSGTRLSFLHSGENGSQLSIMAADGSDRVVVPDLPCPVWSFAWAQNARFLAFVCIGRYEIRLLDIDRGLVSSLSASLGSTVTMGYPAWSPDGSRIVCPSTTGGLILIDTVTGELRTIVAGQTASLPAWSPEGARIAYVVVRTLSLYVVQVATDDTFRVATGVGFSQPAWSPDGAHLAFSSDTDGEIHVIGADGTARHRLTDAPGLDGQPTWSPDGCCVAFSSGRDGNSEIYLMKTDGSGQRRLTFDGGNTNPQWIQPAER